MLSRDFCNIYAVSGFDEQAFDRFKLANKICSWDFGMHLCKDWRRYISTGRDTKGWRTPYSRPNNGREGRQPLFLDHARLFETASGHFILVSHSYGQLDELDGVADWAATHGIAADVYDSTHDWYFPGEPNTGHTSLLIWHLPGVAVPLE